MKSILILGSKMHYNLEYYAYESLKELGYEVHFYGYSKSNFSNISRMITTRSRIAHIMAEPLWLKKIGREILQQVDKHSPDLVLVCKGEFLTKEVIEKSKNNGAKMVLWYPDDPRFYSAFLMYIAPYFDHIFTYSNKAIDNYKNRGIYHVSRLPFGCFPKIHKK
ncbi:MAG: hypothetical protein ACP5MW_06670, partial [Thermoplasmata archaeon]